MSSEKRYRRHLRIRRKVHGTPEKPRLCVFRSNRHIYAQLLNDMENKVISSSSTMSSEIRTKTSTSKNKTEQARLVGKLISKKAKAKKINKVVFDRGGYKYHGRIQALAEGAKEGGLEF